MCTAITYKTKDHYFGRTLDLEYTYEEQVTITPRNYEFKFRTKDSLKNHYAIIGMATVADDYPLYYEATNEYGLSMAGLRFAGNAVYFKSESGKDNIASFELIPYLLCRCKTVMQARALLRNLNLTDTPFSEAYPPSPLHWLLADRHETLTLECTADGMHIYPNEVGVLTNNPPFPFQMLHLSQYLNVTVKEPKNRFSDKIDLSPYSRGMGAMGLPGDLSSASRFVRAAFVKLNAAPKEGEEKCVSQFFHILSSTEQQEGCVEVGERLERTEYSSCVNCDRGIYYYRMYDNSQITAVDMFAENLEQSELISFPLVKTQQIYRQNEKAGVSASD